MNDIQMDPSINANTQGMPLIDVTGEVSGLKLNPETGEVYNPVGAPQVQAAAGGPAPSAFVGPLTREQMMSELENLGGVFANKGFTEGLRAYQSNQPLRMANQTNPQIVSQIANNPNPKNDRPAAIGINSFYRGLDLTNQIIQMAGAGGINLQQDMKDPVKREGFFNQIKGAFEDSRIQPGSIDDLARRDYFTALIGGKGFVGAMEAFGNRYNQLANQQIELRNDLLKQAGLEIIKNEVRNQQSRQVQQQLMNTATQSLANSGLPTASIPELASNIAQVLAVAKEQPDLAIGAAQSIIQNLLDSGAPVETVNRVAAMLNKSIPETEKDKDEVRALQAAGASDRLIARFRFGLQDARDAREAQGLLEQQLRSRAAREVELEIQKRAALLPSVLAEAQGKKDIDVRGAIDQARQMIPVDVAKQGALLPGVLAEAQGKKDIDVRGAIDQARQMIPVDVAKQAALLPGTLAEARAKAAIEIAAAVEKEIQLMPLQLQKAGLQKQAEAAGEVLAQTPGLTSQMGDIKKSVELIDAGKHNIGSGLSVFAGRGPVAQALGAQFETENQRNTRMIMDTVQKLAADGLKTLGSNPSTVDLQFWTENKPKPNSDPKFVKEWIEAAQVKIASRLGWAQGQLGQEGPPAPVAPAAPGSSTAPRVRKYNPQTGKLE